MQASMVSQYKVLSCKQGKTHFYMLDFIRKIPVKIELLQCSQKSCVHTRIQMYCITMTKTRHFFAENVSNNGHITTSFKEVVFEKPPQP